MRKVDVYWSDDSGKHSHEGAISGLYQDPDGYVHIEWKNGARLSLSEEEIDDLYDYEA